MKISKWFIGVLLLLGTACGSAIPIDESRDDVVSNQDITLIGVLDNYNVYEVDVEGGTCYVAAGYQAVSINCKED